MSAALAPHAPAPEPLLADIDSAEIADKVREQQKLVYGTDDRKDLFEIINPKIKANAATVVSLVKTSDLIDSGDGTFRLDTQVFQDEYDLCSSERFAQQPVAAFCSGVLVGADLVATAGHCLEHKEADLPGMRFVFGFCMKNATTAQVVIPKADVYTGVAVVGHKLTQAGTDWSVVRLDRPVTNRTPAKIRRLGKLDDQQRVHVIGHPCGLPLKIAAGARVRDNASGAFFVANLDTYGGNSGSPVFSSATYEVEGLLVRGDTDFVKVHQCNVSVVCPNSGCRGEDVTRVSEFLNLIP
jgi:V8-like Glu-specific endopeptidase